MPRLLKLNNRILNAKNFREALGRTTPTPEYLYLYFGKSDEWTDENSPDTPTEDISYEFTTRDAIIGIKRITVSNTAFVVPRHTWTTSTVYAQYDADDADLFTKEFYVINSSNNVYKCLNNNSDSASLIEPTGTSTSSVATGDGYTWKFMYNLSTSMISNFLTSDWLPVPYGGQKTSFQTAVESAAAYASGSPAGGHGLNASEELGAKYVMLSVTLEGDEDGTFPVDDDYRQFGLWLNPLLISTGAAATGNVYEVNSSGSDIEVESGSILSIDNRRVISRDEDQAEVFQLIMTF